MSNSTKPVKAKQLLLECSWEVCNQVGGIYTVIRSKTPSMIEKWGDDYCLIGPFVNSSILTEIDPLPTRGDVFGRTVQRLQKRGIEAYFGRWLITGRPKVILINPDSIAEQVNDLKYRLWEDYKISSPADNELIDNIILFGYLTVEVIGELLKSTKRKEYSILGHFHEWMAGIPVMETKRKKLPVKTVFTTHATQLGRHLAINSPEFYGHLPFFKWKDEAGKFNIAAEAHMEYHSARSADVFTTVSDVTARECKHLLKRKPEVILPNGLNIERFEVVHESQNLHSEAKEEIHQFVMGHFFQSYAFDLDKTVYFFTSGRYEYKNKGFDLTLESLRQLNERLKKEDADVTVVMFFITRRPYTSINPQVMHSRALMEEIRENVEAIGDQVVKRLFWASTTLEDHRLPQLNEFVDDYWRLRYRRTIQSWKTISKPTVVTHDLVDTADDDILKYVNKHNLLNDKTDKVKIVYHPDFISTTNPLFGLEYDEFVRGCHLGIFPSYYEPWGYTPLECIARGIPAITSDLSGFGDFLIRNVKDYDQNGLFVIERGKKTFKQSAKQLTDMLYDFLQQTRRERVIQRNLAEEISQIFDWQNLGSFYDKAYTKALKKG